MAPSNCEYLKVPIHHLMSRLELNQATKPSNMSLSILVCALVLTVSSRANDVTSTLTKCPQTKLVVSGYSQGAQVVHNAANILGTSGMAGVSSVVVFGDPLDGTAVTGAANNTKVICHFGDNICDGGDLILLPHLTYAMDADDAADFVVEKAGL